MIKKNVIENNRKWIMISWAPYSRMSQTFASELLGKLYCIHYLRFQTPIFAPVKYILMAIRTLIVLFKERPKAIHVQNPPFIAGLIVQFYCWLSGSRFVLHYHSAAFGKAWDWAIPLQKYIARKAGVNIVTNNHWADIVRSWGGRTLVMTDPFLELPVGEEFPVENKFNIAFVSTFAHDEPLAEVLCAAKELPDVNFYITGNKNRKPKSFFEKSPTNVTFTGFLDPYIEYPGLLRAVDAVMVLTTRDHTLQLGGCEAVAVGKPLITSNWQNLKDVFPKGTVYVSSSAESIIEGIKNIVINYARYLDEIKQLRGESQKEWSDKLLQLNTMMGLETQ
jgi:glycosyltransferase involved in cell wall biosynthesis